MNLPNTLFLNQNIVIRVLGSNMGCLVEFPKANEALKINKIGFDILTKSIVEDCNVSYWVKTIGKESALSIIGKLCELKILVKKKPSKENKIVLKNTNWESDYEYFKSTNDLKFLDYSPGGAGYKIQSESMIKWGEQEPDIHRTKKIKDPLSVIDLPKHKDIKIIKNKSCFLKTLSLANCQTREKKIYWKGNPLIRRNVPSGGSRHPIETYLLSHNIEGVVSGTYHINISEPELRCISKGAENKFKNTFDGILIFTAVYARNMFRYREPRTFRSVHMDAGHLIELNRMLLSKIGCTTDITFSGLHYFEEILNIDGISESFVGALGFKIPKGENCEVV